MSIASQIEDYADGLSDAYAMVAQRGGTMPAQKNMANLDTAIATIPSGGGGNSAAYFETMQNGFLGPKQAAYTFSTGSATYAPNYILAHAFSAGNIGGGVMQGGGLTSIDLSSLNLLGAYACYEACAGCHNLTSISFPTPASQGLMGNGERIFQAAFQQCTSLQTVDLSMMKQANSQYAFYGAFKGCTALKSVNLSQFNPTTSSYNNNTFTIAFLDCTSLDTIDMSALTSVACSNTFNQAFSNTGLKNTNFMSGLTSITGVYALTNCFSNCKQLTSAAFPNLATATGSNCLSSCFANCTALTSVDLPKLSTLGTASSAMAYCFSGCSSLPSVTFTKLSTVKGSNALQYCFRNCTSLQTVSFPALTSSSFSQTNIFNNMLNGCTGVTVHFPSAIQNTIGSWADVTAGFGGTNTTVLFDL